MLRLNRLRSVFIESPIYFITACTNQRRQILDRPPIHAALIRFSETASGRRIFVGRYVIMPDHIHFFARFGPESMSLSIWMKTLKNYLSKTLRESIPSPHWQKGFHDHVIRSSESYDRKWEYVRDNPVRAGLVSRCEDWPYQGEINRLSVCDDGLRPVVRRAPGTFRRS